MGRCGAYCFDSGDYMGRYSAYFTFQRNRCSGHGNPLYFARNFVIVISYKRIPDVLYLIVHDAFSGRAMPGGSVGMALLMGIKRGLFSNEAGEGSAPNVALPPR